MVVDDLDGMVGGIEVDDVEVGVVADDEDGVGGFVGVEEDEVVLSMRDMGFVEVEKDEVGAVDEGSGFCCLGTDMGFVAVE